MNNHDDYLDSLAGERHVPLRGVVPNSRTSGHSATGPRGDNMKYSSQLVAAHALCWVGQTAPFATSHFGAALF
jgi:hypothetical protein